MGYARHVGRVGALAVALGVGLAVASSPGVALADPGDSSSDGSSSSSGADASGADGDGSPSPSASSAGSTPAGGTTPAATTSADGAADAAAADDADADDVTGADDDDVKDEEPTSVGAVEETPVAETPVAETPVVETLPEKDNDSPPESGASTAQRASRSAPTVPDPDGAGIAAVAPADEVTADEQTRALTLVAPPTPQSSDEVFTAVSTALQSVAPAPTPQRPQTLIGVVTEFVAAILSPLLGAATDSPIQIPFLTAALSLVRNEFEKLLNPRQNVAPQQTASLVNSAQALPLEDQHVLVIGIDGTNLSRILALQDPNQNGNFLALLDTSTTAASSIVGHTTISNPSWSSILTGAWGERTGVINNVFTPWTYNRFPTVFDQIEALNEDIDTTVIANWNVINAIGAAGAGGADTNLYVTQIDGDTDWLDTDDLVATLTVDAINAQSTDPSFLFSYFVGVDENGHMYGGDSPQYTEALINMNTNLGLMLQAVEDREGLTGEDWTIVVVTDHGHQPQQGFGHGFNSPDETATFVIVDGPGFQDGWVNQAYEIVDTTPTVLQIFGGGVRPGTDGVPLQSLGDGYDPGDLTQLVAALNYEISQNTSPNFLTDTALTLRTIFTSIPYFIYDFGLTGNSGLPSFLALPAQLLFSGLYVATNIPAQIVAFGTGVYGARLFPILPPPAPDFTPVNPQTPAPTILVAV